MKRRALFLLAVIGAAVLLASGVGLAESQPDQQRTSSRGAEQTVKAMTRNVYHGIDAQLANALRTPVNPPGPFLQATAAIYHGYHNSKFLEERAAALAGEIEETQPDVIGLQEAVEVTTGAPNGPSDPAVTPDLDYLEILLAELAERGLQYEAVVENENFSIETTAADNPNDLNTYFDFRHTDSDVVLVRKNSDLEVLNTEAGDFAPANTCVLPSGIGPLPLTQGWVLADVKTQGKTVRFINTHLDGECADALPNIQLEQAKEILDGPVADAKNARPPVPVVLLGDLNSLADVPGEPSQTYRNLLKAGFSDAWIAGKSRDAGFTCCQADHLDNDESILSDRRDYVLFRGDFKVPQAAEVVGANPSDLTQSGLWPSNHAGVVAKLGVPQS
jgi:endonuclease/exonuclease/phosphatase family metal-dependent hydrolase